MTDEFKKERNCLAAPHSVNFLMGLKVSANLSAGQHLPPFHQTPGFQLGLSLQISLELFFFFFFFKAKLRNPNKTPVPRLCPQILIQLTEAHPVLSFLNSLDSYKGQPRSSPLTDWRVPWVRQACRRCGEQDWPAQGASSCGLLEVGHGCCWERQTMRRRIQTKSL